MNVKTKRFDPHAWTDEMMIGMIGGVVVGVPQPGAVVTGGAAGQDGGAPDAGGPVTAGVEDGALDVVSGPVLGAAPAQAATMSESATIGPPRRRSDTDIAHRVAAGAHPRRRWRSDVAKPVVQPPSATVSDRTDRKPR